MSRCTATHRFGWMPLFRDPVQCELEDNGDGHNFHYSSEGGDAGGWRTYGAEQPPPIANDSPAIVDLVLADIHERDRIGQRRYGTRLQAHNGRDALRDAYEEALDLAIYLRQAIAERDAAKGT